MKSLLTFVACTSQLAMASQVHAGGLPPAGTLGEGDHVSLRADAQPLVDFLQSVSRASGIAFTVQGDASHVRISDSFERLELVSALRRVLSPYSSMLVDHGVQGSHRRIEVILLGSSGRAPSAVQIGGTDEPADAGDGPSAELLLAEAVSSGPAAERSAAAEAIAYRDGGSDGAADYAEPLLRQLLSDPDEALRGRALEILKDTADELPFDAIAQVAREDASAARRVQALELLIERSENGESHEPLRIAMNDPEPSVRQRARELIEDWHLALDGG